MSMIRCYCGNVVNSDDDPEGFYHKPGHFICTFECSDRIIDEEAFENERDQDTE